MVEITCKCGKSKKRFKVKINSFFINDCCIEQGYDHLGNLKEVKPLNNEVSDLTKNLKKSKFLKKGSK